MDGTHLAAGTVAGEGSTGSGGGTRVEDLAEVGWSERKGTVGGILSKLRVAGSVCVVFITYP